MYVAVRQSMTLTCDRPPAAWRTRDPADSSVCIYFAPSLCLDISTSSKEAVRSVVARVTEALRTKQSPRACAGLITVCWIL